LGFGDGFWGLAWYKDQTIGKKGGGDVKSGWVSRYLVATVCDNIGWYKQFEIFFQDYRLAGNISN